MKTYREVIAGALIACSPVVAAGAARKKPAPDIVATIRPTDMSRTIAYDDKEIPAVRTRINFQTVIVLPKQEQIMDVLIGDKTSWKAEASDGTNIAYVKPEKAGARTNLNLVAASGNVYSFLLAEGDGQSDLKVIVQAKDPEMAKQAGARPKWVSAAELEQFKKEVEATKGELAQAKADAAKEIAGLQEKADQDMNDFKSKFPASLKHDYKYSNDRRHNFDVKAIAHSDKFTYIYASPQETPSLYEVKDGKPNLISFSYQDGVYIAPKVMDAGYLAVGKHKLNFKREE